MSTQPDDTISAPLWAPSPERAAATQMRAFMTFVSGRHGVALDDYRDLHRFSVDRMGDFWTAVWDFTGVIAETRGERVLMDADMMPGAAFFPDARLNFAQNLLRRDDAGEAIVFRGETKVERRLSWRELNALVSRLQQAFAAAGVGVGDRVAAMTPNMPEAVAAMLAAASLGATFSSCSPDFGERGVLDRFGQIAPKAFVACDGYWYGGKRIEIADKLEAVLRELPSVELVVIAPYLGQADEVAARLPKAKSLDAALAPFPPKAISYVQTPFAHPLYILFSSGTTGVPKCIVHSVGGTLLQHLKEHRLHCDIRPGERFFYFTTCGWMMWNWLVSGLASEATLLLYDGSPFATPGILFDFAQAERMQVFGTSAKYIDGVRKAGLEPGRTHDLASVRLMTSTGSPLAAESFDFVRDSIKADMHLASISGGTDIVSCFVGGDPTSPVWRGEIQAPGLGMAVDVWTEDGRPAGVGIKGELVCTRPFPSMPVMFWNDADGRKYRAAYFERFPGVWCHGDFAEWTAHGGVVIHGRSDATLNPGGVRIGTAEIYAQVERVPEVTEALCIGQDWEGDVRVVLFVRLAPGVALGADIEKRIRTQIRVGASPRHVPAKIVAVADIPRTKSGKITELAVRDVVHGREVKNKEALANPEALDLFRALPELAR
jgi:acetoacetyl-CoA synthetase